MASYEAVGFRFLFMTVALASSILIAGCVTRTSDVGSVQKVRSVQIESSLAEAYLFSERIPVTVSNLISALNENEGRHSMVRFSLEAPGDNSALSRIQPALGQSVAPTLLNPTAWAEEGNESNSNPMVPVYDDGQSDASVGRAIVDIHALGAAAVEQGKGM